MITAQVHDKQGAICGVHDILLLCHDFDEMGRPTELSGEPKMQTPTDAILNKDQSRSLEHVMIKISGVAV